LAQNPLNRSSYLTLKLYGGRQPRVLTSNLCSARTNAVCTPSMGVNSWGESPLWENQRPNARKS